MGSFLNSLLLNKEECPYASQNWLVNGDCKLWCLCSLPPGTNEKVVLCLGCKVPGKEQWMENIINLPDTQENKSKIPIRPERTKYLQRRTPFKSFLRAGGDFVVVEVFGGFALLSFRVALVH